LAPEAVLWERDIHTGVEPMLRTCLSATLALQFAGLAYATDTTDSLTGLPLPDASSGMKLYEPMKLDPVQVCKSTQTTNFYTVDAAKTSAAIAWYGAHLKGFRHVHGYGAGRTQDEFVNADGTLLVGVTGSPAPDGVDTEVYAIVYATLKPGASEQVLRGLMSQHLSC
jgi:hypothetical protein